METLEEVRMYCGESAANAVEENVLMLQAIGDVYESEIKVAGDCLIKFKEWDLTKSMSMSMMNRIEVEKSMAEVKGEKVTRQIFNANMIKPGCLLKLIKMIRGGSV